MQNAWGAGLASIKLLRYEPWNWLLLCSKALLKSSMEIYIFFVSVYLSVSLSPYVHGQLNTVEKQTLLDLHNELRGAAGGGNLLQTVSNFYARSICARNSYVYV